MKTMPVNVDDIVRNLVRRKKVEARAAELIDEEMIWGQFPTRSQMNLGGQPHSKLRA